MEKFRLLITDLTEYGTLRCVAGWDQDRQKIVRPEPHPLGFWEGTACGNGRPFAPGNIIVTFDAVVPNPKTELPHLNEDRVVRGPIKLEQSLSREKFLEAIRKIPTIDSAAAFNSPVKVENSKAYVPREGTDHPSLRGLLTKGKTISFVAEKYGDKPARARCLIDVPNERSIDLSIAAADLREIFRKQGIDRLKKLFAEKDDLHIRLGLSSRFFQRVS